MEKDLAQGKIGTVGDYEVDLKGKKIILTVKAAHAVGSVGVVLEIDGPQLLDMCAAKIPGNIDNVVLGGAKAILFGE